MTETQKITTQSYLTAEQNHELHLSKYCQNQMCLWWSYLCDVCEPVIARIHNLQKYLRPHEFKKNYICAQFALRENA